jgi:hypothetical protein
VAGALLAVEEYGQRLAHALAGAQARSDAVDRALAWLPVRLGLKGVVRVLPAGPGEAVDWVTDQATAALHADGTWEVPPDTGRHWSGEDAGAVAGAAAAAAFTRAGAALGVPQAPVPPEDPLGDVTPDVDPEHEGRPRTGPRPR